MRTAGQGIPHWLRFLPASDRAASSWYIGAGFFFARAGAGVAPSPRYPKTIGARSSTTRRHLLWASGRSRRNVGHFCNKAGGQGEHSPVARSRDVEGDRSGDRDSAHRRPRGTGDGRRSGDAHHGAHGRCGTGARPGAGPRSRSGAGTRPGRGRAGTRRRGCPASLQPGQPATRNDDRPSGADRQPWVVLPAGPVACPADPGGQRRRCDLPADAASARPGRDSAARGARWSAGTLGSGTRAGAATRSWPGIPAVAGLSGRRLRSRHRCAPAAHACATMSPRCRRCARPVAPPRG